MDQGIYGNLLEREKKQENSERAQESSSGQTSLSTPQQLWGQRHFQVEEVSVNDLAQQDIESEGSLALSSDVKCDTKAAPKLWAVAGGKGGVGKSLISANFAFQLARRGKRVLAVDLDLGGANLHTCMGLEPPKVGVADWISGRSLEIEELWVPSSEEGLKLLSGAKEPLEVLSLTPQRRAELFVKLRSLDFDHIIIDLGAGSQDFTVDVFNAADEGVLSVLPEPTSVENVYRFIRTAFYKRLMAYEGLSGGVREVLVAATDPKNILGIRTPADLFAVIERMDAEQAGALKKLVQDFKPSVVMNQVRSQVDVDVGRAICSVCRRYFGLDVSYPGYIDYDNCVWKAVRAKKAVLQEFPRSILANRIERLTSALLKEERGLFP